MEAKFERVLEVTVTAEARENGELSFLVEAEGRSPERYYLSYILRRGVYQWARQYIGNGVDRGDKLCALEVFVCDAVMAWKEGKLR